MGWYIFWGIILGFGLLGCFLMAISSKQDSRTRDYNSAINAIEMSGFNKQQAVELLAIFKQRYR